MTTAAAIEPGVIVCPSCNGYSTTRKKWIDGVKQKVCQCDNTGTIPDPRIAAYYGSDPAAFIAQCCQRPRDDERLRVWGEWCEATYRERGGEMLTDGEWWIESVDRYFDAPVIIGDAAVQPYEAAAILRSAFPPPWLCGEACKRCEGTGEAYGADRTYNPPNKCPLCNGLGRTPPAFDPRWATCNVLMLARAVRGGSTRREFEYGSQFELRRNRGTVIITQREGDKRPRVDERIDIHLDRELDRLPRRHKTRFDGLLVTRVDEGDRSGGLIETAVEFVIDEQSVPARAPRFDRMGVLADALDDAGVDCEEMIAHARSGGPFVEGDWLLSLILSCSC